MNLLLMNLELTPDGHSSSGAGVGFIIGDAGFGMHNPLYAQALLDYALTLESEIVK